MEQSINVIKLSLKESQEVQVRKIEFQPKDLPFLSYRPDNIEYCLRVKIYNIPKNVKRKLKLKDR